MRPSKREMRTFAGLRRIIATLRGPDGCPWDRVQTHQTLAPYVLEESSETLDALEAGDPARLSEELGDLLLQVLLHTQIAEEDGEFTLADVVSGIAEKLVRRHPHVFADAEADTPEAVIEQWDDLKRRERGDASALQGIPRTLPSLAYAQAVQRRVARAGFAYETVAQAWDAVEEEVAELRDAPTAERQAEAGDLLAAIANLLRWLDIDAEEALREANRRFARRFTRLETLAHERSLDLASATLEAKLTLWEEAKHSG